MNQATPTSQRIEPGRYCVMLRHVREQAAVNRPGLHVSGLKITGGIWQAMTSAGPVPVRDLTSIRGE